MTERIYAYLVLDVLIEPTDPLLELAPGVQAPIGVGEIMLNLENFGNGTHSFGEEIGLAKITYTVQYVGTGEREGDEIRFGLGEKRLLNLISIGLHNEAVLKDQIHEFADKVKEKLEEVLLAPRLLNDDTIGNALRAVDQLEKHFFDRKDR